MKDASAASPAVATAMRSFSDAWLRGRRVTVMGLGRFGGGAGVTQFLLQRGADVLLTDQQDEDALREPLQNLQQSTNSIDGAKERLHLRLGAHDARDFTDVDLVIANPAVPRPWENPYLLAAQQAGVPVTTEIRLLTERLPRERVIGITGSAGKSTTAAMMQHLLTRLGERAHLGGNIGGSLLNQFDAVRDDDWIVLELSSAMLHWLGEGIGDAGARGWSPRLAVITNVSPNHLDWHGSAEHYRASKENITRYQGIQDALVRGDEVAQSERIAVRVPGKHNEHNAAVAITALRRIMNVSWTNAVAALADFAGLPHRLKLVLERDGLRFFNDSKSTTPEATVRAVDAVGDREHLHLIAGGYDKGSDLAPIALLSLQLAGLYCIGATGAALAEQARTFAGTRAEHCRDCGTLERAVKDAIERMRPGDTLLLSPGCASWDQFVNFEERGERFIKLVTAHQAIR